MNPDGSTIAELARRHGIELLVQHGSTVTGATHDRSDVDLAVLLRAMPATHEAHAALDADLGGLFPDREVDVAILNRADPLFLKKVLERCRLLHGPETALQRLRILAFKRYVDHRKYLRMEREYAARVLGLPAPS